MSETDDTENLLVIPPNFFLINLDSDSDITICEKPSCVVDDMMNHVDDLRYKLSLLNNQICHNQPNSSNEYCHSKTTHNFRSSMAKCNMPMNDIEQNSITTKVPLRNHSLYSETPSMFSDISSISIFPSVNDDHMLSEIDTFLTKTIAGFEKQKFSKFSHLYSRNRINNQNECIEHQNSDYRVKSCSVNSEKSLNPIQTLEIYDGVNGQVKDSTKVSTSKETQDKNINYLESEDKQSIPEEDLLGNHNKHNEFCCNFTKESQLSESNRHIYSSENSEKFDNQHNKETYNEEINSIRNSTSKVSESKDVCNIVHKVGLEHLWNCEFKDRHAEQETERLRREHCEREIQILQTKLLESQEKLAIALRVDKAKDHAINQLKLAWQRLANNYENKDLQLNMVISDMQKDRLQLENDKQSYIKSCESHKAEINNSYELVKSLKQKIHMLEKLEQDLNMKNKHQEDTYQCQIKNSELQFNALMKEKNLLAEKNNELTSTIDSLRNELDIERKKVITIETKCKTLSVQYDNKISEFNILQEDKDNIKMKLTQEQEKNNRLEILKRNLNNALDEYKSHEGKILSEVRNLKKQLETQKRELKLFYQNQVEAVVRDKMQEFQNQLEVAEKCMESEIQKREQVLTEKLNNQMQSIIQQSELEINLMKEKHKEEIELCKLQIKNAFQHNSILKEKLSNYYTKRGKIAEQLHKVMQNQWQAALQIISSPSILDKNADNEYNGIFSARNINKTEDLNVLNQPEKDKKPLQDESKLCDKKIRKNSVVAIPTVSKQFTSSEIDLDAFLKQLLLQPLSENNEDSPDWLKVSQSTPILKKVSDDFDLKLVAEKVYCKNLE